MPADYKLNHEKKLLVVSYSGELTVQDIIDLRVKGMKDPEFNPSYHILDDLTAVTSTNINYDNVNQIASDSVAQPGVKRALVAVTNLQLGMANMYKVVSEPSGQIFKIFKDYDTALEWVLNADVIK